MRQSMDALASKGHNRLRKRALKKGAFDVKCSMCMEVFPAHISNAIHECRVSPECPMVKRHLMVKTLNSDDSFLKL